MTISDADLLALAHRHKYDGPPEADNRIVAMMRAAIDLAEALGSDKPEKSDSKRGLDHAAGQQR